jgi:hypothetical protein
VGSETLIIIREFHLSIDGLNYEGEARVIDFLKESQLAAQVSEMMNAKYQWDQGLILELEPLNFS